MIDHVPSGRLRISLGSLARNYAELRKRATGQVAAVVKADGYGLGATEVAKRLILEGCPGFFVATTAEGVTLRKDLPEATCYVLEGVVVGSIEAILENALVPVLNTVEQIHAWRETGQPAVLHVDTGMQRLGLPWDGAGEWRSEVTMNVSLLMTHFARADSPEDPFTQLQIQRIRDVAQSFDPQPGLSLCNSAGLLTGLGPETLGRAGIGLYGSNPFSAKSNPMAPVVSLEGRVLQTRLVDSGVPVGYSGAYTTTGKTNLATIGVGYADGVPRLVSDTGRVCWNGQSLPIVGRVSMDMLHVDATSAPGIAEGDWVEVIGANVPVDEVAHLAQTLGYEVLTGLSRRCERVYQEAPLG